MSIQKNRYQKPEIKEVVIDRNIVMMITSITWDDDSENREEEDADPVPGGSLSLHSSNSNGIYQASEFDTNVFSGF